MIKPQYEIDKQLIIKFSKAIITRNNDLLEEVMFEAEERLQGLCFCSAGNARDCTCGAWDNE